MIMLASFGRGIQMQFGGKYVWWLYLLGGLLGGIFM